jgi:hypothetical protein
MQMREQLTDLLQTERDGFSPPLRIAGAAARDGAPAGVVGAQPAPKQ